MCRGKIEQGVVHLPKVTQKLDELIDALQIYKYTNRDKQGWMDG